jgi:hypothetical protein
MAFIDRETSALAADRNEAPVRRQE